MLFVGQLPSDYVPKDQQLNASGDTTKERQVSGGRAFRGVENFPVRDGVADALAGLATDSCSGIWTSPPERLVASLARGRPALDSRRARLIIDHPESQRKESQVRVLASVFAALLLTGCGSTQAPQAKDPAPDPAKPAPVEVSFARDIQSIVKANCLPCHSGANDAQTKFNWTTYEGVMAAVAAGKPDSSKFYQRLHAGTMPPSGKLDSVKLALVYKWISEGAKNN